MYGILNEWDGYTNYIVINLERVLFMAVNGKYMMINGVDRLIDKKSILNRRKFKKRLMKYVDALKALKAYGNGELELIRVIDNTLNPGKSISHNCQVEGCNQRIRYEYVLRTKIDGSEIIAGSTCVWDLLGLSEHEIKDFGEIEKTIKDFHKMIMWKRENEDVYKRVKRLEMFDVKGFEVFWKEIQYSPLNEVDTEFIRGLDMDDEIQRWEKEVERVRLEEERKNKQKELFTQNYHLENDKNISDVEDDEYNKIMSRLDELFSIYGENQLKYYKNKSINNVLNGMDIRSIKRRYNRHYYDTYIKNDSKLSSIYNNCDSIFRVVFEKAVEEKELKIFSDDLRMLDGNFGSICNKYKKQLTNFTDKYPKFKGYWNMMRLKYNILM